MEWKFLCLITYPFIMLQFEAKSIGYFLILLCFQTYKIDKCKQENIIKLFFRFSVKAEDILENSAKVNVLNRIYGCDSFL